MVYLCVCSVVPESDYNSLGINAFNQKFNRGDYFQPEFQDLGLQPVFGSELNYYPDAKQQSTHAPNAVVGYTPRYAEYKTAFDTLHGEFRNGKTLSAWSSSMVVDYASVQGSTGVNISTFKVNPKVLDRIFAVDYDGSERTDQFMCSAQLICKVIRPMSITGHSL